MNRIVNSSLEASIESRSVIHQEHIGLDTLTHHIIEAWDKIAPTWPLQDFIARNPLSGLESLSFKDAMRVSTEYFDSEFPAELDAINTQTIKWCQAFFDKGQATIHMPGREAGLYKAWKDLAFYDNSILLSKARARHFLTQLSDNPKFAIQECLQFLKIRPEDECKFLTVMLLTMPGWAGYVKYLVKYANYTDPQHQSSLFDYLAFRIAITSLLWPDAATLIGCKPISKAIQINKAIIKIETAEAAYRKPILASLKSAAAKLNANDTSKNIKAQLVFCIDVRSEPYRRAIEMQDNYETYGFAGFFGVPVSIKDYKSKKTTACCPALLKPKHLISAAPIGEDSSHILDNTVGMTEISSAIYQTLKYNFTTTFALVETLGPWFGCMMLIKTFAPRIGLYFKNLYSDLFGENLQTAPSKSDIIAISLADRCSYAESTLSLIGLTRNFAPIVLLCGHGSRTDNNADASGLDCGACGGHHGGINAQILATILNQPEVRCYLSTKEIHIPRDTQFIAGEHNTTTDEVIIFDEPAHDSDTNQLLKKLKIDLDNAKLINNNWRIAQMRGNYATLVRAADWSQTQPEWGLAKNACFVIGPRNLTKSIDMQGRSFLHSYDWTIDHNGSLLETILTAPMIVAEWINTQYLFSTINNLAYGTGNKNTQNITSKIGIIQGNASDLLYGLSLQSVNTDYSTNYHEPLRLLTIIHSPVKIVDTIIKRQPILQQLFKNGWVALAVLEPGSNNINLLNSKLGWDIMT